MLSHSLGLAAGSHLEELRASPLLQACRERQEEVLLLAAPADRHIMHHLLSYQGYPLVSVDPQQAQRAAQAAACRTVALPQPLPATEDVLAEPATKVGPCWGACLPAFVWSPAATERPQWCCC